MWARRLIALAAGLIATCLLLGCHPVSLQEQQAYVFGTKVDVVVVSENPAIAQEAIRTVLQEFDRWHRSYHAWEPSELTTLNEAIAAGHPHTVSPALADFIREAQTFARQGDHLFDPGIGQIIALWGFHHDEFKAELPDPSALARLQQAHPSIADLHLDGTTVTSRNRAVALDFGGYLKGVALDRAATLLKEKGIHNALINIGGNVMALGDKEGRPWRIGIQHPRQPGPLAIVELHDGEAIGTSGDYQRYFELDGHRYSHLIDPRNARPVEHTMAITVLTQGEKAGTRSDASSKPLFIAGEQDWPALAQRLQITHVLRVDRDSHLSATPAMLARLQFIAEKPDIQVVPLP